MRVCLTYCGSHGHYIHLDRSPLGGPSQFDNTNTRRKKTRVGATTMADPRTASLKPNEFDFLCSYFLTLPAEDAGRHGQVVAEMAGDTRIADELLQLYIDGKKTAASSLAIDYSRSGEPLPAIGKLWVILDSKETPRCIVKTVKIETHRFDQVPEKVAIAEGEGDCSLAYWYEAHRWFFEPYLMEWGVEDLDKEMLITEYFEVVHKSP